MLSLRCCNCQLTIGFCTTPRSIRLLATAANNCRCDVPFQQRVCSRDVEWAYLALAAGVGGPRVGGSASPFTAGECFASDEACYRNGKEHPKTEAKDISVVQAAGTSNVSYAASNGSAANNGPQLAENFRITQSPAVTTIEGSFIDTDSHSKLAPVRSLSTFLQPIHVFHMLYLHHTICKWLQTVAMIESAFNVSQHAAPVLPQVPAQLNTELSPVFAAPKVSNCTG